MNPYGGASTLATVCTQSSSNCNASPVILSVAQQAEHICVQTLRVSAAGFGLVFGSVKLSHYKVSLYCSVGQ